jgi:hypothetical protein
MGFFNLHKPLQYKYKYIYYDPKKEAQQEREKKAKENQENKSEGYKPSLRRGSFREMSKQGRHERRSSVMQSNIRLVVIIIILFLLMFWLLN